MASQNIREDCEVKLAPAVGEEPASEVSSNSSLHLNMDSMEVLDRHGVQDVRQAPAFQENLQPEDQSQGVMKEEGNLLQLSFPRNLWMIVENEAFASVCWNDDGNNVIIDVDLFQREILNRSGAERIIETDSLKTFICQLNLHGFSKICPNDSATQSQENRRIMIYHNDNFQRDKPELLENIWRKGDLRNPAWQVNCIPIPLKNPAGQANCILTPKRKKLIPTRCSPRFNHKSEKEDKGEPQQGIPKDLGPKGSQPFMFSGIWAMKSIPAGCPLENWPPQDKRGPSGKGTSVTAMFLPPATVGMEGMGEGPITSSEYPNNESVMFLYNACHSMLLATISAMSQNESPDHDDDDDDEEQEGSSDYKCVLCEQVKDNPHP